MSKTNMYKPEGRGLAFYFFRFLFYYFMISSIILLLVIYPQWLGWLSPRVYFGFIPIMSFCEFYVEIGFGVSAYIYLLHYWPYRHEYNIEDLRSYNYN